MPNYNPSNISDPASSTGDGGNAMVSTGSAAATAALVLADSVRPCRVAAGTKVSRVVVKNDDLDSNGTPALEAKIGFTPCDGSAQATGDDVVVAAAGAFGQSAATTTYEIFPPHLVTKDSYLDIVVTTAPATGAAGTVYGKVEGEAIGAK